MLDPGLLDTHPSPDWFYNNLHQSEHYHHQHVPAHPHRPHEHPHSPVSPHHEAAALGPGFDAPFEPSLSPGPQGTHGGITRMLRSLVTVSSS